MESIVIDGGKRLQGTVKAGGSKNSALPLMAACLLAEGPTRLRNIPRLKDIKTMADLMRKMGVSITSQDDMLDFNSDNITDFVARRV